MSETRRLVVNLERSHREALDQIAAYHGVTVSELVRTAVAQMVRSYE